jgi:hypothetical protein
LLDGFADAGVGGGGGGEEREEESGLQSGESNQ